MPSIILYPLLSLILAIMCMIFIVTGLCTFHDFDDSYESADNCFFGVILILIGISFGYGAYSLCFGELDNKQIEFISSNINKQEYQECKHFITKMDDPRNLIYHIYEDCLEEQNYLNKINKMKSGNFNSNTGDESHASERNN